MRVIDDVLYIAIGAEIRKLDVSDSQKITIDDSLFFKESVGDSDFHVLKDYMITTDFAGQLQIWRIQNDELLLESTLLEEEKLQFRLLIAKDDLLWVSDSTNNLLLLDVANLPEIKLIGRYELPNRVESLNMNDETMYIYISRHGVLKTNIQAFLKN